MADTRSVLGRGIELWNAHDREGWVGLFDEGADLEAPGGVRVQGRSGAELFYDTWHEAFPDNAIADAVVFGAGEQGAEEARFAGTHTGVLHTSNGDIPPQAGTWCPDSPPCAGCRTTRSRRSTCTSTSLRCCRSSG